MSAPKSAEVRRILILDSVNRRYRLRTLRARDAALRGNFDYSLLWGEALCQYLLHEEQALAGATSRGSAPSEGDAGNRLVIARGPLVFLPGNKATVGYISPLTGLPHYSFVGGRGFSELHNLGLDAIVIEGVRGSGSRIDPNDAPYVSISGRAPDIQVAWRNADSVPQGQRAAYSWLVAHELGGKPESGSVFAVGQGALLDYGTANIGVDGIYHAGRGGAGAVFGGFLRALVLSGKPQELRSWFGGSTDAFLALREQEINPRVVRFCERLSRRDGGTVTKLYQTGHGERPTLPSRNAQRAGYDLADLGARRVLKRQRVGQTGCQWCHVNCRHWHWVPVDYTETGQDRYLDDFEPTYALFSMLDLAPSEDTVRGRLELVDRVDSAIVQPIEQLGLDVIDTGVALAALFEALDSGLVPAADVPPELRRGPYFGDVDKASAALADLGSAHPSPAIRAVGGGPEGLVTAYPSLRDHVFSSGPGTLGNPGHANALWTFLMPLSRYFGHYSGQIYKIPGDLTPDMDRDQVLVLFEDVVAEMLRREALICIGNALSTCAFTFVIFTEEGQGQYLDKSGLLSRTLALYGAEMREEDLLWFGQAFLAQSLALKAAHGWSPPGIADFPSRVFALLADVLSLNQEDVGRLMELLIDVWKRRAGELLSAFGHDVPW